MREGERARPSVRARVLPSPLSLCSRPAADHIHLSALCYSPTAHRSLRTVRRRAPFADAAAAAAATDYDTLAPYFRAAAVLLRIDDGPARRRARADSVMSAIATAMASQRHFYRVTETAIELLLKLPHKEGCAHASVSTASTHARTHARAPPPPGCRPL